LLVWWQKKLPLKNQPSNPIAQLLRAGLDEAPVFLVEARTELLNPEARARIDEELQARFTEHAIEEFKQIISFALDDKKLSADAEERLQAAGAERGLSVENITAAIDAELARIGAVRLAKVEVAAPSTSVGAPAAGGRAALQPTSFGVCSVFRGCVWTGTT
jgi:hypothetical protein